MSNKPAPPRDGHQLERRLQAQAQITGRLSSIVSLLVSLETSPAVCSLKSNRRTRMQPDLHKPHSPSRMRFCHSLERISVSRTVPSEPREEWRPPEARWGKQTQPWTVSFTGEEETFEVRTSRSEVEYMLPNFRHLQAHLRASVGILSKYSDEKFGMLYLSPMFAADTAAVPFTEQIANDQILFTHHHSAVSETLRTLSEGCHTKFGLPDNCSWRSSRNSFCHGLLASAVFSTR
jgi:hypothetical protein